MTQVTIEGTLSPAAGVLKRGERATVALTPRVERLIKGGFVKLVNVHTAPGEGAPPAAAAPPIAPNDDSEASEPAEQIPLPFDDPYVADDEDEPDESDDGPSEPARNAKKEAWQAFLTEQGIEYPESASRDDLVAGWVNISQQRAGGS